MIGGDYLSFRIILFPVALPVAFSWSFPQVFLCVSLQAGKVKAVTLTKWLFLIE